MPAHGARARYVAGCRCEPCTNANRTYQRAYMQRRYVPAPADVPRRWGVMRHGYKWNDGHITH